MLLPLTSHLAHSLAQVFLDSDNLADLHELRQHVAHSDVIIALQTPNLLTRPFCLVELVTAIDLAKPILGLRIEGPKATYNFEEMSKFMADFPNQLRERAPHAAVTVAATQPMS